MLVVEAIDILKKKAQSPEEQYALSFLIHELDVQFCYGWGAACSETALQIFLKFFSESVDAEEKNIDCGELALLVASNPVLGPWRLCDFPNFDEYRKWFDDGQSKEFSDIPF